MIYYSSTGAVKWANFLKLDNAILGDVKFNPQGTLATTATNNHYPNYLMVVNATDESFVNKL